jgi:rRNA-processing protein FCF1
VLVDGGFVVSMFQHKVLPIERRVGRVLQVDVEGGVRYHIARSAVEELTVLHESLEKKRHPKAEAFRQALQWIQKECTVLTTTTRSGGNNNNDDDNHDDGNNDQQGKASASSSSSPPLQSPRDAIKGLVKRREDFHDNRQQQQQNDHPRHPHHHDNNGRQVYVVGTQDEGLLDDLRSMGTVPILRLANSSVLLLEQPSRSSQRGAAGTERSKWTAPLPDAERALVELARADVSRRRTATTLTTTSGPTREESQPVSSSSSSSSRTKGKAKGPNPLSCKRKRSTTETTTTKTKKNTKSDDPTVSHSKKRRERAKRRQTGGQPTTSYGIVE